MPRSSQADGRLVSERYRLNGQLGSGGMGTVWRGWDERLNRLVAVKEVVIPEGLPLAEAELLRTRYLREARAAARLRHPSVVGVYDVVSEPGSVWIVMELVDARDLAAILDNDGPIAPERAAHLGLQLLDALDAAHDAGVLHRDVKPANVLICPDDRAVLTDFGVASVTGDASLTRTGQLVGSPAYLAPERVTGGQIGPPTDLWSLGCTLYAAVEGAPPFARADQFAIIAAITLEPPPPPQRAGLLAPVLHGLLEKDAGARWDSARTRAALERVAEGRAVTESSGWGSPAVSAARTVQVPNPRSEPSSASRGNGPHTTRDPRQNRGAPATALIREVTLEPPAVVRSPERWALEQHRRFRWGPLVALLVLLGAAVLGGALAITYAGRSTGTGSSPSVSDQPAVPGPASPVAAPPSAGRSATPPGADPQPSAVQPSLKPPVKPPAFQIVTNKALGYRLTIPGSWSEVCLQDGQTCRYNALTDATRFDETRTVRVNNVIVFVHDAGGKDALTLAQDEDASRAGDAQQFPNYKQVRLERSSSRTFSDASVLEFTFENKAGSLRHVLIFRTVVNGKSYDVSLNGPDASFAADLPVFDRAVSSLQVL